MCRLRKVIRSRRTADRDAAGRLVREAEDIVHRSWLDQLTERRQEVETALRRAADRCDTAQRSLSAAQAGGDPRKIATSHSDLEKAVEAARKASLAWERICQALSIETGMPPNGQTGPRRNGSE